MFSEGPRRGPGARGAQRTASGSAARQNAAPYSRPAAQRSAPSQSEYPPSQLSIRGASSIPTQVLVSNLARGTSTEDVRQTFNAFGDIIRVRERRAPANNHPSVAFEVLFEERKGAVKAVEQLHGALADGRILSVTIEEDKTASAAKPEVAKAAIVATPAAAVTAQQPPAGPRAGRTGSAANGRSNGHEQIKQALTPAVSKMATAVAAQAPPGPALQNRLLTGKERKAFLAMQAQRASAGPKKGPQVKGALAAATLQSRLGSLPLAQRLGDVKGGAGSDLASLQANKSKKTAKKAAATAAAATTTATGQGAGLSASAKKRQKSKAKKAAAAAVGTAASGKMELD